MSPSPTLCAPTQSHRCRIEFRKRLDRGSIAVGPDSYPNSYGTPASESGEPAFPSDEVLLCRYRDLRNPGDFAELVRRFSGVLGRYIARYLDDPALVEDVLQDVFLRVHSKCNLYREGWPVRPWLYAVARHGAVNELRKAPRCRTVCFDQMHEADARGSLIEQLANEEPGPFEQVQESEQRQSVRELVGHLPDRQRKTVELAYYEGLSYAEIAGLLGIPLGTVRSRLHGAITRLRAAADCLD